MLAQSADYLNTKKYKKYHSDVASVQYRSAGKICTPNLTERGHGMCGLLYIECTILPSYHPQLDTCKQYCQSCTLSGVTLGTGDPFNSLNV